ncbi:DUF692 domain-containing protein [Chitinilyticum litopenaei]|uniref:DUF692 domain-containing protein n=1 Tax=Chitinilyticum litopenaei TaxID=1121276 RepID=UPI0004905964|nr:DUF692 domain-containing protein [Chitinilyticum litopenaei]
MDVNRFPAVTGLGLRAPHVEAVLASRPDVAWWEVHSENYFGGGAPLASLLAIRRDYPLSLHGVGLGLGRVGELDARHLAQLRELVPRVDGVIAHLADRIAQVQDVLQRPLLIENVSAYVGFANEVIGEGDLMAELHRRTGCGLLVDLNNFYVNALNLGVDPLREIAALPAAAVAEIHVAGFEWFDGTAVDTHGAAVSVEVLALLDAALRQWGPRPVLLERDSNLGEFAELYQEYLQLALHVKRLESNTLEVTA